MTNELNEEDLSYVDAVAELEDILQELETVNLDVDMVVAKVRRASMLVKLCREKVQAASMQVKEILESETPS